MESHTFATVSESKLPICNFLWVGPPCDKETLKKYDRSGSIIDHDIGKIAEMAQQIENPVYFWCLDEHVEHYKNKFNEMKGGEKVKVCSIEKFITECSENELADKEGARFLLEIKKELLKEGRKKTIDYITLKDAFSYFLSSNMSLLSKAGGFIFDSNNEFKSTVKQFNAFPNFCVPWLKTRKGNVYEWWAMHSPTKNSDARDIFRYYRSNWHVPQEEYKKHGYSKKYHQKLANLMMNSLYSVLGFPDEEDSKKSPDWEFKIQRGIKSTAAIATVEIQRLGIKKTYFNTHKDRATIKEQWLENLEKDNDIYFKSRYFNVKDLKEILKLARYKRATKCVAHLSSELVAQQHTSQKQSDFPPTINLRYVKEDAKLSPLKHKVVDTTKMEVKILEKDEKLSGEYENTVVLQFNAEDSSWSYKIYGPGIIKKEKSEVEEKKLHFTNVNDDGIHEEKIIPIIGSGKIKRQQQVNHMLYGMENKKGVLERDAGSVIAAAIIEHHLPSKKHKSKPTNPSRGWPQGLAGMILGGVAGAAIGFFLVPGIGALIFGFAGAWLGAGSGVGLTAIYDHFKSKKKNNHHRDSERSPIRNKSSGRDTKHILVATLETQDLISSWKQKKSNNKGEQPKKLLPKTASNASNDSIAAAPSTSRKPHKYK